MALVLSSKELNQIREAVETGDDLSDALYQKLFDHYCDNGEMPYGTAKARDGDPFEWIANKLPEILATNGVAATPSLFKD